MANLKSLAIVEPLDLHARVGVGLQAALDVGALALPQLGQARELHHEPEGKGMMII